MADRSAFVMAAAAVSLQGFTLNACCSCSEPDCRARPVRGCFAFRRRGGLWWCRGERRARCRGPWCAGCGWGRAGGFCWTGLLARVLLAHDRQEPGAHFLFTASISRVLLTHALS